MNAIPRKALSWYHFTVAFIIVWTIGFASADRLPYLRTAAGFRIRAFVIFPLLVCLLVYFGYIRTSQKSGGTTGYRYMINRMTSRREKVRLTVMSLLGIPAICAAIAYSTIEVSAWSAYVAASSPFSHTYVITRIRHLGGPLWTARYDMTLSEIDRAGIVHLILTREPYLRGQWKTEDVTCVHGRSSIFGSIVEVIRKGPCPAS